jgi:hypothetical protein
MRWILPQIYTDEHGYQLSEIVGDVYLLHLRIRPILQGFRDGTGLALSARSDESGLNNQKTFQACASTTQGWSSI